MLDKRVFNVQQLASVLHGSSDTAVLDCRFFLADILQVQVSAILHDVTLCAEQYQQLQLMLQRRCQGEPVAYILGYTEFWGLRLQVMPGVLIPRPDTECLVTQVLQDFGHELVRGLDLGAGSAAISLALASERRNWHIDALERSDTAIHCAQYNYNMHCDSIAKVNIWHASWCAMPAEIAKRSYHFIVANPPYIAPNCLLVMDAVRRFEPSEALFADNNGLAALQEVIALAPCYLVANGVLYLEHGCDQGEAVRMLLCEAGFSSVQTTQDFSGLDRVSIGIYAR